MGKSYKKSSDSREFQKRKNSNLLKKEKKSKNYLNKVSLDYLDDEEDLSYFKNKR